MQAVPGEVAVMTPARRHAGAVVYCPTCLHQFGGMAVCPWDNVPLLPIEDDENPADPIAVAFYAALAEAEGRS